MLVTLMLTLNFRPSADVVSGQKDSRKTPKFKCSKAVVRESVFHKNESFVL